jgi:pimeloyl-ACP methyl ester carboxylesterase
VPPETRYASCGDLHIAYQVIGDNSRHLLFVSEWLTNVEVQWEEPSLTRFFSRLSSFARVIVFDKRGSGLSDPVPLSQLPTFDYWMDDARAVIDAAGADRPAVVGFGHGGLVASLFAATYPERTSALVLINAYARIVRTDDYPAGIPAHAEKRVRERLLAAWGTPATLDLVSPTAGRDERFIDWFGRYQRMSASPGTFAAMARMIAEVDIRPVLPVIRVPTLVLHRAGDRFIRPAHGRYLAEHIPGARYVELPGAEHYYYLGDVESLAAEIEEFMTGARGVPPADRVLATVLFTDIVGSTEHAAAIGDHSWRELLQRHDAIVRRELTAFSGHEARTTGDGFVAIFDGPARAVQCALSAARAVRSLGIEIRAGVHTGECERHGKQLGGIAFHIGARVVARAGPGEVLVSRTVVDLVTGSGLDFTDRGSHELKGVPGMWQLFAAQP